MSTARNHLTFVDLGLALAVLDGTEAVSPSGSVPPDRGAAVWRATGP